MKPVFLNAPLLLSLSLCVNLMANDLFAFMFHRRVFGSSERGGEERGADVQRRELVHSYASPVRAEPDPGDGQPADERVAAAAAAVKRQHRPRRTRTSYIPCVETPSSVIILRLIDFLRGVRDTRARTSAVRRS